MKYVWEDLPERKNLFTVKNTAMINLNTGKTIQHYSTNTKIVVVQKCITPEKTYYRTQNAAHHYLNYAFEAEAFGLPNEKAPSVHFRKSNPKTPPAKHTPKPVKKIKIQSTPGALKDGEEQRYKGIFSRIFRRKNG